MSFSVSESKAEIISSPRISKASSVGAKTVNEEFASFNVSSSPAVSSALTNVVKLPLSLATSTIPWNGSSGSVTGL